MKRQLAVILITLILVLTSCDLFDPEGNDPGDPTSDIVLADTIPDWYPYHLSTSTERQSEYETILSNFISTYNIENTRFTPNNLCGQLDEVYFDVSDRIKVCDFQENVTYEASYNNGIISFINNWKRLVSVESFEIDSSRITEIYGSGRFYIESKYDLPVYKESTYLGNIFTSIDDNGYLIRMTSTLLPQLPVPINPMLDAIHAKNMIVGYPWYFYGSGGERIDCIVSASQISSVTLNVYIDTYSNEDEVLYRLIWCVSTDELPVDFLVDAMTGEFIRYIQNFRT